MRALKRSMRLRPVLVSSKLMASFLASGDMYIWRLVLMAATPSGWYWERSIGDILQPGCNDTDSTCFVCNFDAKATLKRRIAVLALPWIDASGSVWLDHVLCQQNTWTSRVRTYAEAGLYVTPCLEASVKPLVCCAAGTGWTYFEVPVI